MACRSWPSRQLQARAVSRKCHHKLYCAIKRSHLKLKIFIVKHFAVDALTRRPVELFYVAALCMTQLDDFVELRTTVAQSFITRAQGAKVFASLRANILAKLNNYSTDCARKLFSLAAECCFQVTYTIPFSLPIFISK